MSDISPLTRAAIIDAVAAIQNRLAVRTTPGLALTQMLDGTGEAEAGDPPLDWGGPVRDGDLIPAAVLVPLVMHEGGATVLLTQRTANLRHHPGQISFPGGHIEDHDPDPEAAALREAHEEIGLGAQEVEIIGRLDSYQTGTGFEVVPVIGLVASGYEWQLDETEVAEIFEVPLAFVMDPANHRRESRMFNGRRRHYFVLPYEDRYIWGATAGMLINLYEVLSA
ncbi:MAG: CoA pyrophosphatase [Alphaproteobacteria bacterium]|nr:CoA pyrophosphatase [Alphaproteobacteria bacterium]